MVKVVNSLSGEIITDGSPEKIGQPLSTKKNGGYGLRSVRAVVGRYNGNMLTDWDSDTFTAYVMVNNE